MFEKITRSRQEMSESSTWGDPPRSAPCWDCSAVAAVAFRRTCWEWLMHVTHFQTTAKRPINQDCQSWGRRARFPQRSASFAAVPERTRALVEAWTMDEKIEKSSRGKRRNWSHQTRLDYLIQKTLTLTPKKKPFSHEVHSRIPLLVWNGQSLNHVVELHFYITSWNRYHQ